MKNLINKNETVNKINEKLEVKEMTITDLLKKGTINNKEEYELFSGLADLIEIDDCGDYVITDIRIFFDGGFAEIYGKDDNEDVTQDIRFYRYNEGQVDTFDEARDLTIDEIKEKYEDEIKEKLSDICRWIHQPGNDLTYTLYFDKRQEKIWTMEHTGNSYSGDSNDIALGSYSYQYEDASSDVPSDFFFGYLEDQQEIVFEKMYEPDWDDYEGEELTKLEVEWDEYEYKLDNYKEVFWDDYIDWLIDLMIDDWVEFSFEEIRGW